MSGDNWNYSVGVQGSSQIITTNKPTPSFVPAGCRSCRPTNSIEALNLDLNLDNSLQEPEAITATLKGLFQRYTGWSKISATPDLFFR